MVIGALVLVVAATLAGPAWPCRCAPFDPHRPGTAALDARPADHAKPGKRKRKPSNNKPRWSRARMPTARPEPGHATQVLGAAAQISSAA